MPNGQTAFLGVAGAGAVAPLAAFRGARAFAPAATPPPVGPGITGLVPTETGDYQTAIDAVAEFEATHPGARSITDPAALNFIMSLETDEAGNVWTPQGSMPLDFVIDIVATTPFTGYQLGQWGTPTGGYATDPVTGETTVPAMYNLPFTGYYQMGEFAKKVGERPAWWPGLPEAMEKLRPTAEKPGGRWPFSAISEEERRREAEARRRGAVELAAKTTYPFLAEQQRALRGTFRAQLPTFTPAGGAYWESRFPSVFEEFGEAYKKKPARTEAGVEQQFRSYLGSYPFLEKLGRLPQARGRSAQFAPRARWLTY